MRNLALALLISTALPVAALAQAQQPQAQQPQVQQPAQTPQQQAQPGAAAPAMKQDPFVSMQPQGTWQANNLIGTTVIGADDQNVGQVNDVLVDQNGQVLAVIVGVGGFLGIGQKDVAISMDAVQASLGAPGAPADTAPRTMTGWWGGTGDVPDRIHLNLTRAQLDAAPEFRSIADTARTGTVGQSPAPPATQPPAR